MATDFPPPDLPELLLLAFKLHHRAITSQGRAFPVSSPFSKSLLRLHSEEDMAAASLILLSVLLGKFPGDRHM